MIDLTTKQSDNNQEDVPSIVKNPFMKNKIKKIFFMYSTNLFDDTKWSAQGWVEFKNGNTEGKQQFENTDPNVVMQQIREFINNLK